MVSSESSIFSSFSKLVGKGASFFVCFESKC